MNKLLREYVLRFDDYPKLYMTMTYDDEIYQELMQKAIDRNSPITNWEIELALDDKKVDLVVDYQKEKEQRYNMLND